jgi:hypothetical protein
VTGIVVFTFITSQVIIFAAKAFFKEPAENTGKVPKNLVWNEESGGTMTLCNLNGTLKIILTLQNL